MNLARVLFLDGRSDMSTYAFHQGILIKAKAKDDLQISLATPVWATDPEHPTTEEVVAATALVTSEVWDAVLIADNDGVGLAIVKDLPEAARYRVVILTWERPEDLRSADEYRQLGITEFACHLGGEAAAIKRLMKIDTQAARKEE